MEWKDEFVLLGIFVIASLIGGFVEAKRERKEFRKWLKEGRWKYEEWPRRP